MFINVQEMKKKRNEVTVEIRKNKREETLQKRRNVPTAEDTTGLVTGADIDIF